MLCRSLVTKKTSPELLWKQFTRGDMDSFRSIYEANYKKLYVYGLKYVTPTEVEDCIQNLFLYILQHRKSIIKVKNVEAYLFISFRNQLFKIKQPSNLTIQQLTTNISNEISSYTKEPFLVEIQKLLGVLSPRENEMIHLKYYQGFKNLEIADSLGLEYQTVRNTLANALKKLRKAPFKTAI